MSAGARDGCAAGELDEGKAGEPSSGPQHIPQREEVCSRLEKHLSETTVGCEDSGSEEEMLCCPGLCLCPVE